MDKPIRILQVVHEMNQGGIENFIMNLYRSIDRNSIQFDFIVHVNNKCLFDNEINKLGGEIYHCPDYRVVNHFQYVKWWNNFFASHPQYKIIHSHLDSSANIHLRVAKKHGLITIAHAHNTMEGNGIKAIAKSIIKIGFNNCCDYKFGCSEAACKWLYKENNDVEIIKNGIIASNYTYNINIRNELRRDFNVENKFVIGSVARFSHQKNHNFIIDIFEKYSKINKNAILFLIGDGDLKKQIEDKVNKLNLADKVFFLGFRDDVLCLLNVIDFVLMPSFHEGLPVSIIEAQASGLKCLLSDVITKEVDITSLVEFESLQKSSFDWAERISNMIPYERKDTSKQIIDAGYNIASTAQWITDFYLKLLENI